MHVGWRRLRYYIFSLLFFTLCLPLNLNLSSFGFKREGNDLKLQVEAAQPNYVALEHKAKKVKPCCLIVVLLSYCSFALWLLSC